MKINIFGNLLSSGCGEQSTMPVAKKRRARRARSSKKHTRLSSLALMLGSALIVVTLGVSWLLSRSHSLYNGLWLDTRYEVTGVPTIDADFINQVLASYDSPARGKGQTLYDLGTRYGVDPVYALAFFMHESRFGTTGVAQVTRS